MEGVEVAERARRSGMRAYWDAAEFLARLVRGRVEAPVALAAWCAAFVLLAPIGLVALLTHVLPLAAEYTPSSLRTEIAQSDLRKQGTVLYDAQGRFVGAMSGLLDSDPNYNEADAPVDYDADAFTGRRFSFRIYPDHKTAFVEEAPSVYLACLYRLEDSRLGHPLLNPHGIDAAGLVRMPVSVATSVLSGNGLSGAGGSTLANMYVQQLVRPKNGGMPETASREGKWDAVVRKLTEYWNVPVMHAMLTRDGFEPYAQYAARHLPHVTSTGGERGTVWGVELAAQIVFGKSAAELEPAEQMILAASARRQIIFEFGRSTSGRPVPVRAARERWDEVIGRAKTCARDARVAGGLADRRLRALDVLQRTVPQPRAHADIETFGRERYGELRWLERARDPFRRANIFLYNAVRGLRAELRDAFGEHWSHRVARIETSIDVPAERRFTPAFRTLARNWLASRRDLNPDYRDWATYRSPAPEPEVIPELVLAVADNEGRLVRYYSAREEASYFGLQRGRLGGAYDPSAEDRQIASVAKVGAAIVLAQGAEPLASVDAIAHSRNGATSAALRRADPDGLRSRRVLGLLRWTENSSCETGAQARSPVAADRADAGSGSGCEKGQPRLPLFVSLSKGQVSASPRTVHWAMATLLRAFIGDDRPALPPTLVQSVTFVDLAQGRLSAAHSRLPDAYAGLPPLTEEERGFAPIEARLAVTSNTLDPRELAPAPTRDSLRALLRAPACSNGNLRSLALWCAQPLFFIKSGTDDVSDAESRRVGYDVNAVRAVWLAGGVQFRDGRAYSFVLVIGGDAPSRPLTRAARSLSLPELEASDAASLIHHVLIDLEKHSGSEGGAFSHD